MSKLYLQLAGANGLLYIRHAKILINDQVCYVGLPFSGPHSSILLRLLDALLPYRCDVIVRQKNCYLSDGQEVRIETEHSDRKRAREISGHLLVAIARTSCCCVSWTALAVPCGDLIFVLSFALATCPLKPRPVNELE